MTGGRPPPRPLTANQTGLWLLDRYMGGRVPPVVRSAGPFPGVPDEGALRSALHAVAARHAALRTTVDGGDSPVQRVHDEPSVDLTVARPERTGDPVLDLWAALRRLADRPLGAGGPLWRAVVVDLSAGHWGLLLGAHPVVADQRSLDVVGNETIAVARGLRPSALPPAVPYLDHVDQVEGSLGTGRLAELGAWWRARLDGARDRPAAVPSWYGAESELLARRADLPGVGPDRLPGLVVAALAAVLSRRSTGPPPVVGVAVDSRGPDPAGAAVVGPCTSWAPLVLAVDGAGPATGLLAAATGAIADAAAHAPLPVARLLAAAGGTRYRPPVVDVAVDVDAGASTPLPDFDDLGTAASPVGPGRSTFDLAVRARWAPGGVTLAVEHRTGHLGRAGAAQLLDGVTEVAAAMATGHPAVVDRLPLLAPRHRPALLATGEGPPGRAGGATAVDLLDRAVADHRDEPAVVDERGACLTYGDLDEAAGRLAAALVGRGAGPEEVVAVSGPRSPALVVAMVAVLRSGGAFLAVDPAEPATRSAAALRDAGVRLVVGDPRPELRRALPALEVVDPAGSPYRARRAVAPDRLAYVCTTSGSTGSPKGVLVEHAALANQLCWARDELPLHRGDRVAFTYPLGFDAGLAEVLGTLVCGATVVVAAEAAARDAGHLLDLCRRHRLTALDLTPARLEALLWHPRFDGLPTVRRVVCGGDVLTGATARRCLASTTAELVNLYGPTEATITAAFHRVHRGEVADRVPIGRPVAGTDVRVLGPDLEPVPLGVIGEVCIGGVQVARGYTEAADRRGEGERFVDDPYRPGGRLFRTGDVGRVTGDGAIELVGRSDGQVQLRGLRVEPAEVEAVVARHHGVRACAVVPVERDGRARTLRACVVPAGRVPPTAAELRRFALGHLPAAMVPTRWTAVDALPRTGAGKLDRRRAAALAGRELPGEAPAGRRLTPAEGAVAAAFAGVLGVGDVGPGTDFFEAGGDSLAAVELVVRLARDVGARLEVRDVLEAPTPAGLADRLEATADVAAALAAPPLARRAGSGPVPASPAQHAVLTWPGAPPDHPVHHARLAVRLGGPLRVDDLAVAVEAVVARHGVLRTALVPDRGGRWHQHVHDAVGAGLDVVALGKGDLGAAADGLALRPFDLGRPPLARFGLVRLADDDHLLVVTAHRAVADGWSLQVLLRDLSRWYFHRVEGCPPPAHLAVDYSDYSEWHREVACSPSGAADLTRWAPVLAGTPGPCLGDVAPSGGPAAFATTTASHRLDLAASQALVALARRRCVGLPTVVLAAVHRLVADLTGSVETVVGIPESGRRGLPAVEGVVGPFERVLPVRAQGGCAGSADLLTDLRAAVAAARAGHVVPPELHAPGRTRVTFAPAAVAVLQPGTVSLEPVEAGAALSATDLAVSAGLEGDAVVTTLRFRDDRFSATARRRVTAALAGALTGLAADA